MTAQLAALETEADAPLERLAEIFKTHGAVIVRRLIPDDDIARFRNAFLSMIEAALGQCGAGFDHGGDLDAAYDRLCIVAPERGLGLRGLGKDLLEYHYFLAHPKIMRAISALFGHAYCQINYDQCLFRIDRPNEDHFAFNWHQDYPYNLLSMNAVIGWAPLSPIDAAVGPLRIVPGSHTKLLPVTIDRSHSGTAFAKHATIAMTDPERLFPEFEANGVDVTGVEPGDMLLIHALLVHRSGHNRSNRCRWVFNPRYGDLLDPMMVKRSWATARAKAPFIVEQYHPDIVTVLTGTD